MSTFGESDFIKLARLCRLYYSDKEKKVFQQNLQKILSYVEQLADVPTEGVEPCSHVLENLVNAAREDSIGELLPRASFLANAPDHIGGMIRIPPILHLSD